MKILLTSGIYPPDIGGPAYFVPKLKKWLEDEQHLTSVITLTSGEGYSNEDSSIIRISRKYPLMLRIIITTFIIIREARNCDLIFSNGLELESCIASLICFKTLIIKVVGDKSWEISRNRGFYQGTLEEYQLVGGLIPFFLRLYRDIPLFIAKKLITPSNYLKKIIINWNINHEKVYVIYNATSPREATFEKKCLSSGIFNILCVCRLVPWKRLDSLILAVKKFSDCSLTILGDGPEKLTLENLIRVENLQSRVLLNGEVSNDKIHTYFQEADIFVLNSSYEGLPHVLLEAMINKLPIISTPVGGVPEIIINNYTGILLKDYSLVTLVDAIGFARQHPKHLRRLSRNAYILATSSLSESSCKKQYMKTVFNQTTGE